MQSTMVDLKIIPLERPPSLIASSFDEISHLSSSSDEESVYQAPSREELSSELCKLTDARSCCTDLLASLRQLHVWALVAKTNPDFCRNLLEENAVPTLLYLVKNTREHADHDDGEMSIRKTKFLLDKAVQVLFHCTYSSVYLHDYQHLGSTERSTASSHLLDRLAADMAVRFVQYKGVDILVTKLEQYEDDYCPDDRPCLFKSIWNTLLNIAACNRAVALPEYDKSRQKDRMMDAVILCMGKVGRTMPASWLDERLFLALHNLLRTNRCVDSNSEDDSCHSGSTRPDDSVRTLLAETGIVTQCLPILKRNQKVVFQNRNITALAVTFLYACLRRDSNGPDDDSTTMVEHKDSLSRSLLNFHHLSLLVPFVVKSMKAFPHCEVIQGTGCLLMHETPKYLSKISLDIDDDSVNDQCSIRGANTATRTSSKAMLRSVVRAFLGQCW